MIAFIQSLSKRSDIIITGNSWVIPDMNIFSGTSPLYSTTVWYQAGRTYFVFRKSHVVDDGRAGIAQYYQGQFSWTLMPTAPQVTLEYHDNPVVQIDKDGYIFIFHEDHIGDRSEIWKSNNPYDISTWTYEGITPTHTGDYPKIYYHQDEGFTYWGRTANSGFGVEAVNSMSATKSVDGINWGSTYKVAEPDDEGYTGGQPISARFYPNWINSGNNKGGWNYGRFNKHILFTNGSAHYKKNYAWKTPSTGAESFVVFYNLEDAYSKNVILNGHLTETELDANFMYNFIPDTHQVTQPGQQGYIRPNGDLYLSGHKVINNVLTSGTHVFNNVSKTWSFTPNLAGLWFELKNDVAQIRNVNNELNIYTFNDEKILTIADTSENGYFGQQIPENWNDVPKGQKTIGFWGTQKNGDTNISTGTIQNDLIAFEIIKR